MTEMFDSLHPSVPCDVPGCTMKHGWYPRMEHDLLERPNEQFQKTADIFYRLTGNRLTRKLDPPREMPL